jgi:hypothetical protein
MEMLKSKWLILKTELQLKLILKAFSKNQYESSKGVGFELVSYSEAAIQARFIEKLVVVEEISDPFGAITELETVRYVTTAFRLHFRPNEKGAYFLEISAPPRSLRTLVMAFQEAFDGVTIDEVSWSILKLFNSIKRGSPRARIVRLRAVGVSIPAASEARLEITSPTDAYADYREMFPRALGNIDRIRIERPFSDVEGPLELSVNGLCSFDESADDIVRSLILNAS